MLHFSQEQRDQIDQQKPAISGYRPLSEAEIRWINEGKALAETVGKFINELAADYPLIDQRWLAIAKTNLQQGFMALTRAIARPDGF